MRPAVPDLLSDLSESLSSSGTQLCNTMKDPQMALPPGCPHQADLPPRERPPFLEPVPRPRISPSTTLCITLPCRLPEVSKESQSLTRAPTPSHERALPSTATQAAKQTFRGDVDSPEGLHPTSYGTRVFALGLAAHRQEPGPERGA